MKASGLKTTITIVTMALTILVAGPSWRVLLAYLLGALAMTLRVAVNTWQEFATAQRKRRGD
jgi:hypothetical protein